MGLQVGGPGMEDSWLSHFDSKDCYNVRSGYILLMSQKCLVSCSKTSVFEGMVGQTVEAMGAFQG